MSPLLDTLHEERLQDATCWFCRMPPLLVKSVLDDVLPMLALNFCRLRINLLTLCASRSLQNNLDEFYAMLSFVCPGSLGSPKSFKVNESLAWPFLFQRWLAPNT